MRVISTVQVGITALGIITGAVAEPLVGELLTALSEIGDGGKPHREERARVQTPVASFRSAASWVRWRRRGSAR